MSQDAPQSTGLRRIWPYVAVAVLTFVTLMGTINAGEHQPGRDADALAIAITLICPLSLLLLRRYPITVLGVVLALTLVYMARGYPYGPVIASVGIALIGNIVQGNRIVAWVGGGIMYAGLIVTIHVVRDEPWSWPAAFGVAAWMLLILVVGEFVRVRVERSAVSRRARAETERRKANEERLRIARELHDVVAHHMSLINVQAGVALHLIDREPERVAPALETIKTSSKEALGDLRSLIDLLREHDEAAPRQPLTRFRSLESLIERSAHAGLTVSQHVTGTERPLPSAVETAAHRIIQEAITNVVRHADADRASIDLDYGADMLTLRIDDNGDVDADRIAWGNGLRGMQERASTLGGTLQVTRAPAGGVRVTVTLRTDDR
ncbi:sensor histidine kinase [Solicola gregarius]|uniref:histidine kinase n=1 Tax=Solicola gregarius TaxID=2908642 RepID=A0AA46TIZ5_9ACTN|nr:sensor histidine kinase [Solicola gregarius]UYM06181.1 sensor histidine kinase [Solicola gregarius]